MSSWEVITSQNYDIWFQEQTEDDKAVIFGKVYLLEEFGPNLGRPHADTIKGSDLPNLKELRARTDTHVFRVAYIFDPERKGLLLIGGDKKGKNQKKFYTDLISQAEQIYAVYLKKKAKEK
ncbi:toxin RelE [Spirochaetia bacterium]|nr:toxin RelE [Spirochaetia bacterium]